MEERECTNGLAEALIVPINKKGSRTKCENYHGISLLSIPGKVYASILETRMRTITEGKVLEDQGHSRRDGAV